MIDINQINFRCPRSRHHMMTLEMCAARKVRNKEAKANGETPLFFGCTTCRHPAKMRRQFKERLKEDKGNGKDKNGSVKNTSEVQGRRPKGGKKPRRRKKSHHNQA